MPCYGADIGSGNILVMTTPYEEIPRTVANAEMGIIINRLKVGVAL